MIREKLVLCTTPPPPPHRFALLRQKWKEIDSVSYPFPRAYRKQRAVAEQLGRKKPLRQEIRLSSHSQKDMLIVEDR